MAFVTKSRGVPILHTDVNQYATYFAGTNSQAVTRVGDTSSAYADTVYQRDTTNGYILRAGYGAAGAETLMIDATKSRVIVSNLLQKGAQVFDVEAYGATGDGTTDDTTAIQAAVTAAKNWIAAFAAVSTYIGAVVRFSKPVYAVSMIQVYDTHNILFQGLSGHSGTIFRATKQTSGTHTSAGYAVFDVIASSSITFENCHVDTSSVSGSNVVPMAGWNFGGSGTSGVNSTACRMTNCGSFGKFQVAAVVTLFTSDLVFVGCGWQQWKMDRPCVLVGSAVPSSVGTVESPYTTAAYPPSSYSGGGGDITFIGCEMHSMPVSGSETAPYNTGNGCALYVQAALKVSVFGGNMASESSAVLIIGGATDSVDIHGSQWYSDSATYLPAHGVILQPSATVKGLVLDGVNLNNMPATGGGILRFGGDATLTNSSVRNLVRTSATTTPLAITTATYGSAATVFLSYSDIDCDGLAIDISTGTGPTMGAGVVLRNPGTITKDATADKSTRYGDSYTAWCVGGTAQPASTGNWRLQNAHTVYFRNQADNANLRLFESNTSNQILIGDTGVAAVAIDVASSGSSILSVNGSNKLQVNSTGIGFNNATPIAKPTYTVTNGSTDRALNVTADTTAQGLAVLGSLIADLQSYGLLA